MKTSILVIFVYFFPFLINGQILFSEYSEGSAYNKYIEIYNYSSESINLYPQFVLASCTNGCIDGNNFYINEFPEDAVVLPGDVYVVAASQADEFILNESDYTFQYCCGNGDDAYALMLSGATGDVFDSTNALDIIGNEQSWQEGIGWDVAGVEEATKNHTLVRKSSVSSNNTGDWNTSAGTNSNDSEWIVFEIDDWTNLGFHNYDGGGSSDIYGCTCLDADNYSSIANVDNGSCIISGACIDPLAINFIEPLCEEFEIEYINQDCQYLQAEMSGCMDLNSCNFFDFEYTTMASNMSIVITDTEGLIDGDIIGGFFIDPLGYLHCAGSIQYENQSNTAIALWGDDSSSTVQDGLEVGDPLFFLILRGDQVFESSAVLTNSPPFTNVYENNGFGQMSLSIGSQFVENCVYANTGFDCMGNELSSSSEDITHSKNIISIKDLLGRSSDLAGLGVRIIQYSDGSVNKSYILNH